MDSTHRPRSRATYALSTSSSAASVPGYTWRETVYPYVRNYAAFECPGASPEGGDPRFENRASATLGMNSYLGSDHEYEKEPVPLTISPQCSAGCADKPAYAPPKLTGGDPLAG